MTYNQIRDADMNTGYEGGWCLKFVQDAFKTDHPDPTAMKAWADNYKNGNHYDLPPIGLTVPVYFSLGNEPAGHVAISLDDGYIASSTHSGKHPKPYFHKNLDDLIAVYAKFNGGCKYLGWSEYVGTVQVVSIIPDVQVIEPVIEIPITIEVPKSVEAPIVIEQPIETPITNNINPIIISTCKKPKFNIFTFLWYIVINIIKKGK